MNPGPRRLRSVAVALCAATVFVALALSYPALTPAENQFAALLHEHLGPGLLQAALAITWFGNFMTLVAVGLLVAAALVLRRQWLDLATWVATTFGNGLLNRLLKLWFERPRPLHEPGLVLEASHSFPSGHASGALAVYGLLGWLIAQQLSQPARQPLLLATAALILLIGCSRVLLQVHYSSDVLAGYASATVWLTLCLAASERWRPRPVC